MASQFGARQIMALIIKVLHKKTAVIQVLEQLDPVELEAGFLSFHQDLLNRSFKMEIMKKVAIEDYDVAFSESAIQVSVDQIVKVMTLEKALRFKIRLTEPALAFGPTGGYFFAKYSLDIEGIPAMLEKMPGGSSIKETLINNLLKNSVKEIPWIQLVDNRVYMDFTKAPGFEQLRDQGIYGVDLVNTLELSNLTLKEGKIKLNYKWVD